MRNRLLFHWINLHSPLYLTAHLAALLLMICSRILLLDLDFYRALAGALKLRRPALELRRIEKGARRRSDRQLMDQLTRFYRSAPIRIYNSREEILRYHQDSGHKTELQRDSRRSDTA